MKKIHISCPALVFSLLFVFSSGATAELPTPEGALVWLKDGNHRFVTGKPIHPHAAAERRMETANGQHPYATILTCSDSRVPAEIVFDEGIGDLFVVRVAGNVCNVDETGTIEYGTDHLGTPILVVLGHTMCGAVTAVVTKAELHGSIPQLVSRIKPAAQKAQAEHPALHGKDLVPAAIEANVWQAIEDLLKRSEMTRKRVKEGKLTIVGALYDIESGKVKWLGAHPDQQKFLSLPAEKPAHVASESSKPLPGKHSPVKIEKPAKPAHVAPESSKPLPGKHSPAKTEKPAKPVQKPSSSSADL
jgi:carbonic anhydrase